MESFVLTTAVYKKKTQQFPCRDFVDKVRTMWFQVVGFDIYDVAEWF